MRENENGNTQELLAKRRALTVSEAAAVLGTTTWMVRELVRKGELRAKRFGRLLRIPVVSLDDFLARDTAGFARKRRAS